MNRIALGLEYDGSQFHGWQKQKNVHSIQSALEKALSTVADEPIETICAGRTDAAVHATAQVVHFDTTRVRQDKAWILGANALLPAAIRVCWAKPTLPTFNARRSAIRRRYRYIIYNHPIRPSLMRDYVAWDYRALDDKKMAEAAKSWVGEHDFSSFRASGCQSHSPIRILYSLQVVRRGDHIILEFIANAFLHHMVRNMVGVLLEIGIGERPVSWAKTVLDVRDRRLAGVTALAAGLYLVEVQYPELFGLPRGAIGPWFLNIGKESVL